MPAPDGGVDVYSRGEVWFEQETAADIASWPLMEHAPYQVRATTTRSADGTRIAVTLLLPDEPRAGVVVIHGSGDSTRRNAWYLDVVDRLARQGIAVWFPDKRGTGVSEGRWQDASFQTLAQDAAAGRTALMEALGSEGIAVGYLGVSQGGWIAPLAAQISPAPFIVSLSNAAVTPNEQLDHEVRADLEGSAPSLLIPIILPIARAVPRWRHPAFWSANGDVDTVAEIRAAGTPTLVLLGSEDEYDNVPVTRSVELYRAAAETGVPIQVRVVEGGGHDLSPGDGVGPIEPDAFAEAVNFILLHAGEGPAAAPTP